MCEKGVIDPEKEEAEAIRKNGEEACKTFVEQTKQLITLASAFIFAPAAVQIVLQLTAGRTLIIAELLFIMSVLAGYVALGAIAGSQHSGEFNVYNKNARWSGLFQFCTYLAGLIVCMVWFMNQPPRPAPVAGNANAISSPAPLNPVTPAPLRSPSQLGTPARQNNSTLESVTPQTGNANAQP